MKKNTVAIAFQQNIIRNLKRKIEDLSNDIVYIETVLKNEKNKRIHETILKNLNKKKKKKNEECQKFYESYSQYILKKNKLLDNTTFPSSIISSKQKKENEETTLSETALSEIALSEIALSETASTCSTSAATEDEKYKILEDLYKKKKKLTKVLDIIEKKDTYDILTNDSIEKVQELDRALQTIIKSYTDCKIYPTDKYKTNTEYLIKTKSPKKIKNDENVINLNNKKLNYLHSSNNDSNNNDNNNNDNVLYATTTTTTTTTTNNNNNNNNSENENENKNKKKKKNSNFLLTGNLTDSSLWIDVLKNKYLNKKKSEKKNMGVDSNAIICKVLKIMNKKENEIKKEKSNTVNAYLDNTMNNSFYKKSENAKNKNYTFSLKDMHKLYSKKENVRKYIMENNTLNKKSMKYNKMNPNKHHITFASDIVQQSSNGSIVSTPFNFPGFQNNKTYLNKINSKANMFSKKPKENDIKSESSRRENHKMNQTSSNKKDPYNSLYTSSYKSHLNINTTPKRNYEKSRNYRSNNGSDSFSSSSSSDFSSDSFSSSTINRDNGNSNNKSNNNRSRNSSSSSSISSSNSSSSNNNNNSDGSSFCSEIGEKLSHLGKKKHIITFTKNGKGTSYIKKKKGSSETYIYDIEIRYENSDTNKRTHEKHNINKNKTKKHKILKISFVKNKSNIYRVKHLSILENSEIQNLPFYDNSNYNKNNNINNTTHNKKNNINNNNNNKTNINITESIKKSEKHKNGKNTIKGALAETEEESALKKELSDIINAINNTYNNGPSQFYGGAPYMIDTIDTNKLRGIYVQLIERQRELENERNFYKNELEVLNKSLIDAAHLKTNTNADDASFRALEMMQKMLQENLMNAKDNSAQINSSDNFREKEKEYLVKEKEYLIKEKEMEKNIFQLQCELKMCKEQLEKEKEINVNLQEISETNKLTMANAERLLVTNEKNNEELLTLRRKCEELKTSVEVEKEKNNNLSNKVNFQLNTINAMQNELDAIKKDTSFNNFRKSVLMKVNSANDEMQGLVKQIEALTEELEVKFHKEKELTELLHKSNEMCLSKNEKLKTCKKKLKRDTILINHMRQEIDYLNVKIENLLEAVEYLKQKIETYDINPIQNK